MKAYTPSLVVGTERVIHPGAWRIIRPGVSCRLMRVVHLWGLHRLLVMGGSEVMCGPAFASAFAAAFALAFATTTAFAFALA